MLGFKSIKAALLVSMLGFAGLTATTPVSYTHLDVYKRQGIKSKSIMRSKSSTKYLSIPAIFDSSLQK